MWINRFRRRDFITLLGGAAATWPVTARAQHATPVVGFLNSASPEAFGAYVDAFLVGLNELGFAQGGNVAMEYRWARGRYDQLPSLAVELVERKVDVIAASGEPAVMAAKAATLTVPLVFLIGGDPVRLGLVESFNRPGANATGLTILALMLDVKRLGLLREALARATTIAVLMNPNFPGSEARMGEVQQAARDIGQELIPVFARNETEIDLAFLELDRRRPDALLVAGDPFFNARRDQIVALAAHYAVPAIYEWRDFAAAGGLMSYGTQLPDLYRQQGSYTGRILKGTKPADLPVLQPTKFEFVLNVKTAKALGLQFPDKLLALADEVIE